MTTVAFDGKELVSDSRQTLRDMILPASAQKIFTPKEGEWWDVNGIKCLAFAFAGQGSSVEYIKSMLREGVSHNTKFPDQGVEVIFQSILVLEDGSAWVMSGVPDRGRMTMCCLPMSPPVAIGSGEPYAYSVMSIGKSAQQAVKHAMRLCPYTNGELQIFVVPPVPEVLSKKPAAVVEEKPAAEQKVGDLTLPQLEKLIRDTVETPKPVNEDLEEGRRDVGLIKVAARHFR